MRVLRIQAGLTQQELADLAGWGHRAIVSQLEKRAEVPPGSGNRYMKALAKKALTDRGSKE